MTRLKRFCWRGLVSLLSFGLAVAAWGAPSRVVSVGGAVTEVVYALGAGDLLVGADTSSIYPEAAAKLPKCGYQRNISAEGVLSLKPDYVLLAGVAGPPNAIEQLKAANVPVLQLDEEYTIEAAKRRITEIAKVLGKEEEAKALNTRIDEAVSKIPQYSEKPRVLFLMGGRGGSLMTFGKDTVADAMIRLSGGTNVIETPGYSQISSESLVALNPDVILTTSRSMSAAGEEGLEKLLPGVKMTTAGKNNHIVVMDDLYLLGFGPRVGDALLELAEKLHQKPAAATK